MIILNHIIIRLKDEIKLMLGNKTLHDLKRDYNLLPHWLMVISANQQKFSKIKNKLNDKIN